MNYPELIHRYLDGEATHDEEQHLFTTLSENTELRKELQIQMQVAHATRSELASVSVPASVFTNIATTLQFSESVPPASAWQWVRKPFVFTPLAIAFFGVVGYVGYVLSNTEVDRIAMVRPPSSVQVSTARPP